MKRLLFMAHRVPYPPDKGERVRAFHEIRVLSEHFRVTLAALSHNRADDQSAGALNQWCEKVITAKAGGGLGLIRGGISLLGSRGITEGYFRTRRLERLLAEESRREPFDLVVAYCSSMLPYLLALSAPARVMDLVDVDSAKWAAYAGSAGWPRSWLYRKEAKAVSALEQTAVDRCDAVIVVSPAEARVIGSQGDKVVAIGNGVDTEYFKPAGTNGDAGPPALVFTGTMDYRPNVDGVCWFVREVWPRLKKRLPGLILQIVGRDPTAEVRKLARQPGVAVTGSVPDVRPYLASAVAAICPLRIARGIQNKVLEAMAMGRAVIASPEALEGLELRIGTDVLQAATPDEWEGHVAALLDKPSFREGLESAARKCTVERYSWEARLAPLVSLCRRLVGDRPGDEAGGQAGHRQTGQTNDSGERPSVEASLR